MKKIYVLSILTSLVMLFIHITSAQTEAENLLHLLLSGTNCGQAEMMQFEQEFQEELPEEMLFFDEPPTVTAAFTTDPVLYARALSELENYIAAEKRRTGTFSYGDRYIFYPLSRAAERGHIATMEVLISCGANVNRPDEYRSYLTPLHTAALYRQPEAVQTLIRYGAQVNQAVFNTAKTPLHLAASAGDEATVQALIRNGAWVDVQDNNGNTPAHLAAVNGHRKVLKFLLEEGALLQKNRQGLTPLGAALHGYILHGDGAQRDQIKEGIRYLVLFEPPGAGKDQEKLDALFGTEWLSWRPKKRIIKEMLMRHLGVQTLEELTTEFAMPPFVERKRMAEGRLPAEGEKRPRTQ